VSSGSSDWVLFNASPDLLSQFRAFPELQPARSVRDTAVRSIVLMDAQIDHTTGLLMLREGQPLEIYSTEMAREDLTTGNPLFSILQHYCGVNWHPVPVGGSTSFTVIGGGAWNSPQCRIEQTAALFSSSQQPASGRQHRMRISDPAAGKFLFYAPGLGEIEPQVRLSSRGRLPDG
jgi:pyrroloquinoline quinone biosynthesis protein B